MTPTPWPLKLFIAFFGISFLVALKELLITPDADLLVVIGTVKLSGWQARAYYSHLALLYGLIVFAILKRKVWGWWLIISFWLLSAATIVTGITFALQTLPSGEVAKVQTPMIIMTGGLLAALSAAVYLTIKNRKHFSSAP